MISAIWVNCMKFYKRVFVKMAEWLPDDVYLKLVYYAKFHRRLNLKCPVTYTEKLNWLKLHDRKMKYHEIVDKYEAKNYVAQILGDRYIIPTYGVWERFEDIDFSTLPQKFAIKTTHDSCHYALVHNKNEMNINDIRKTIEDGLKKNHYYMCREWPYKDLRPRIIAEELISTIRRMIINSLCFMAKWIALWYAHNVQQGIRNLDFMIKIGIDFTTRKPTANLQQM